MSDIDNLVESFASALDTTYTTPTRQPRITTPSAPKKLVRQITPVAFEGKPIFCGELAHLNRPDFSPVVEGRRILHPFHPSLSNQGKKRDDELDDDSFECTK